MPRLRRLRLSCIGHTSARFEEVTLEFFDREGRPANSTVWLRNGGGKTSLLSLFFAGIRPNKRDFLGQRAEQKIRRIEDYVAAHDRGVVVCEWELDAPGGLFDAPPRYLSGVFYQRDDSSGRNGDSDVDRLYFATLVSDTEAELTLDGLPLFGEQSGAKTRRSLNGFRRRLRQLDQEYPNCNVFIEDKSQTRFEEELSSHGIDSRVFGYQVLMNDREGGVSERFAFAEDEEFVDFLLEMAFDQQHADQVHEQLSAFRREIMERNEQLKPELDYCNGLITRLRGLAKIAEERSTTFRDSAAAEIRLRQLNEWANSRTIAVKVELERLQVQRSASVTAAGDARTAAEAAKRLAAAHQNAADRLIRDEIQADYERHEGEHAKAERRKDIWLAAIPLSRVWEARSAADEYRKALKRKLSEHAPALDELTQAATSLANALEHDAASLRQTEREAREEAGRHQGSETKARDESAAAGERAAKDERQAEGLAKQIASADTEEQLLRDSGTWNPEEVTAAIAFSRVSKEIESLDGAIALGETAVSDGARLLREVKIDQIESVRSKIEAESVLIQAQQSWEGAVARRIALETDCDLLRLLQAETIDLEAAATASIAKAADEIRQTTETILRLRVEAAEDERAIHGLRDTGLLPPSQDVQSLVNWLHTQNVHCWSGWEYLETNVRVEDRRTAVRRLPHIAAGIVVADRDIARTEEICRSSPSTPMRLRTAVAVASASAIGTQTDGVHFIIGPTSDAHFDKNAGTQELARLLDGQNRVDSEVDQFRTWQTALGVLLNRLKHFLTDYPAGWFRGQREQIEAISARAGDAQIHCTQLNEKYERLEKEKAAADDKLASLNAARQNKLHDRIRLEAFERMFGRHLAGWRQDLADCRLRVEKDRRLQNECKERAREFHDRAASCLEQSAAARVDASHLEAELSRVKYCDQDHRTAVPGKTEELRSRYQILLSEYESKVGADALTRMAELKDNDAEREDREFRQALNRVSHVTQADVEAELRMLPPAVSVLTQSENAATAYAESSGKLGPLKIRLNNAVEAYADSRRKCDDLAKNSTLPEVETGLNAEDHVAQAKEANRLCLENEQIAAEFDLEVRELDSQSIASRREREVLDGHLGRLASVRKNHQRQFDRLATAVPDRPAGNGSADTIANASQLGQGIEEVERQLDASQTAHESLDNRRDAAAKEVNTWSRNERFTKLRSSISHRFSDRDGQTLESKAELDTIQLSDCVFQIEEKLKEADKQRGIVVHVLSTAVDEALQLLGRVSRMSRLPDSLPQAGKQFVKIESKASDNPAERSAVLGDLVDELLEKGDIGGGLKLIQKAVRRVGRRIAVRVLHPDLHQVVDRISICDMRAFSGGERLTSAILLYCTLMRLRQGELNRRGSSVLLLDNPIGTASRLSFLDMQREVAQAMNVQLIYATAVRDLDAVGALENVIRLRNSRADRRTGRRFIEVANGEKADHGSLETARVAFDVAPSSAVDERNRSGGDTRATSTEAE